MLFSSVKYFLLLLGLSHLKMILLTKSYTSRSWCPKQVNCISLGLSVEASQAVCPFVLFCFLFVCFLLRSYLLEGHPKYAAVIDSLPYNELDKRKLFLKIWAESALMNYWVKQGHEFRPFEEKEPKRSCK